MEELCRLTAPEAFRTVWRRTIEYIIGDDDPATDFVEGLDRHEFLFAWSPGRPTRTTTWREYHPNVHLAGRWSHDDYVDVAGLDIYEANIESFRRELARDIVALDQLIDDQPTATRDVLAITEFGPRKGLAGRVDADWFGAALDTLVDVGVIEEVAYAMTWSNRTDDLFWVPVPCFNRPGCPPLTGFDQRSAAHDATGTGDWGFSDFIASPSTTLQHDLPAWWRLPEERVEPSAP